MCGPLDGAILHGGNLFLGQFGDLHIGRLLILVPALLGIARLDDGEALTVEGVEVGRGQIAIAMFLGENDDLVVVVCVGSHGDCISILKENGDILVSDLGVAMSPHDGPTLGVLRLELHPNLVAIPEPVRARPVGGESDVIALVVGLNLSSLLEGVAS